MNEQTVKSLEEIPYNPLNNTGFESKVVTIGEEVKTIHDTNNLPVLVDAYLLYGQGLEPRDFNEAAYYKTLKSTQGRIMEEALAKFFEPELEPQPEPEPELTPEAKLPHQIREICTLRNLERAVRDRVRRPEGEGPPVSSEERRTMLPSQKESDRRSYYYSQLFDVIVPTAQSIAQSSGLEFDTTQFCM